MIHLQALGYSSAVHASHYIQAATMSCIILHSRVGQIPHLERGEILAVGEWNLPHFVEQPLRPQRQRDIVTVTVITRLHIGLRKHCHNVCCLARLSEEFRSTIDGRWLWAGYASAERSF